MLQMDSIMVYRHRKCLQLNMICHGWTPRPLHHSVQCTGVCGVVPFRLVKKFCFYFIEIEVALFFCETQIGPEES